ncbi:hypothetical protein DL96DRAFT_1620829 [Flagelloscypha sp. PMI_526]|nr:hypothetical protein DL96DRAFT_1620829 [Flagelloscypha sp. PMI_526]
MGDTVFHDRVICASFDELCNSLRNLPGQTGFVFDATLDLENSEGSTDDRVWYNKVAEMVSETINYNFLCNNFDQGTFSCTEMHPASCSGSMRVLPFYNANSQHVILSIHIEHTEPHPAHVGRSCSPDSPDSLRSPSIGLESPFAATNPGRQLVVGVPSPTVAMLPPKYAKPLAIASSRRCPRCNKEIELPDKKSCNRCLLYYRERTRTKRESKRGRVEKQDDLSDADGEADSDNDNYSANTPRTSRQFALSANKKASLSRSTCSRCRKNPVDIGYKTCKTCRMHALSFRPPRKRISSIASSTSGPVSLPPPTPSPTTPISMAMTTEMTCTRCHKDVRVEGLKSCQKCLDYYRLRKQWNSGDNASPDSDAESLTSLESDGKQPEPTSSTARGKCSRCGKAPHVPGFRSCQVCLDYYRLKGDERKLRAKGPAPLPPPATVIASSSTIDQGQTSEEDEEDSDEGIKVCRKCGHERLIETFEGAGSGDVCSWCRDYTLSMRSAKVLAIEKSKHFEQDMHQKKASTSSSRPRPRKRKRSSSASTDSVHLKLCSRCRKAYPKSEQYKQCDKCLTDQAKRNAAYKSKTRTSSSSGEDMDISSEEKGDAVMDAAAEQEDEEETLVYPDEAIINMTAVTKSNSPQSEMTLKEKAKITGIQGWNSLNSVEELDPKFRPSRKVAPQPRLDSDEESSLSDDDSSDLNSSPEMTVVKHKKQPPQKRGRPEPDLQSDSDDDSDSSDLQSHYTDSDEEEASDYRPARATLASAPRNGRKSTGATAKIGGAQAGFRRCYGCRQFVIPADAAWGQRSCDDCRRNRTAKRHAKEQRG